MRFLLRPAGRRALSGLRPNKRRLRAGGRLVGAIVLALVGLTTGVRAQTPAEFFKGKTITMIVGFDVGGSLDAYGRLAASYLGRHIPGDPAIVVENMPGASGLAAANYLYHVAARDGTVLGVIHPNSAFAQIIGLPGIDYDARKFNWIGRLTGSTSVFYTWRSSKTKTLADLMRKQTLFGGIGPLTDGAIFSSMANVILGTKFKMIAGYKGTAAGNLAMERGEVDGMFNIWEGMKSLNADWLRDGQINLVAQFVLHRNPELPQVPTIMEAAKTEPQRQAVRLFLSTAEVGRALMAPPSEPEARVDAIRDGFVAMLKDPDFIAAAARQKLAIQPLNGAALQSLVDSVFDSSADAVALAKQVMAQ
jgi:tripartite-type tricarboxylate transporter receptor subunit TctC